MRVAVVGVGYWGMKHVRVLSSLPDVSEVLCVDATQMDGPCPHGVRMVPTLEAALPHVDAVVIATPPTTHAPLALEAIRAGRHVLVEKPFTTSVLDARALVQAADDAGVVLMVGHTYAYNAVVQRMRALIDAEEFGQLYYLDSARLNLGLYRPDVSVVWDLAAHDVAIMNYLLGSTPDAVGARAGHRANPRFDDVAYLWLEYHTPQVLASIHVSWLDPRKVRRVTVVGSERMAVYDDLSMDEPLKIYDKGVEFMDGSGQAIHDLEVPLSYRYGDIVAPYTPAEEPLLVEDRHFVECILHGRTPLTDGRSGLAVVEALTAVDEALRTSSLVTLDGVRERAA